MSKQIRVQHAAGTAGKVIAARILPGTDVMEGIEEACRANGVKHALVNCFGSFESAGYLFLVPNTEVKIGAGYGAVNRKSGPVEFLNGTGVVCQKDGNYDIHFHAALCDKEGKVFGGHLVKGENPTLTTVDVVITELLGLEMLRQYDEETDLTQFYPKK